MNIIFLSPHFPPTYYQFCVELRKLGATVLAIADEPYANLRPELRQALTEYYFVSDLNDYDQLVRACGFFTHKYGKINRIDSLNEHWLKMDARLRTDFNIVGPKIYRLGQVQRKSQMKQKFIEAGVPVARGRLVHALSDGQAFVKEVGYPVVAKPDTGVGAAATYKIMDESDLRDFFTHKPWVDYFMEEFVTGAICTFDGLADREGEPVFYASLEYSQGVMEALNNDDHIYYYTYRTIPQDLEAVGRKILNVFRVKERFFHFEFFRTPDNRLIALEVNMRPPGGLTLDMFNYANDINLYAEWANMLVHGQFKATYHYPYHCAHVGRKANKSYTHSHEAILACYGDNIVHYQAMHPLFAQAMGDYTYLIRTPDLTDLITMAEFIQALE